MEYVHLNRGGIVFQRRRDEEAERGAHRRANNRIRVAQSGRILSQF